MAIRDETREVAQYDLRRQKYDVGRHEDGTVILSDETLNAIAAAVNKDNWTTEYALAVLAVVRFSMAHPNVQVILQDGLLRIGDNVYGIRGVELSAYDWQQALEGATS